MLIPAWGLPRKAASQTREVLFMPAIDHEQRRVGDSAQRAPSPDGANIEQPSRRERNPRCR